jgi:hypothetical protein
MIRVLLLLFLAVPVSAEVYTVLVYRDGNFPQDRFWEMTDARGDKVYKRFDALGHGNIAKVKDGQPFRVTSYEVSHNGKYGLLRYEPKRDTERNVIKAMHNKGLVQIISIIPEDVATVYGKSIGGYRTIPVGGVDLRKIPADFYESKFSVTASTKS